MLSSNINFPFLPQTIDPSFYPIKIADRISVSPSIESDLFYLDNLELSTVPSASISSDYIIYTEEQFTGDSDSTIYLNSEESTQDVNFQTSQPSIASQLSLSDSASPVTDSSSSVSLK